MIVPSHRGIAGIQGQGPYFIFLAEVKDGRIDSVTFESVQCLWSSAIGMVVCSLIEHQPHSRAKELRTDEILFRLEGIPGSKLEFVDLALQAVRHLNVIEHSPVA